MRVVVVNNYVVSRWKATILAKAVTEASGCKPEILDYGKVATESLRDFDVMILSGSDANLRRPNTAMRYDELAELVKNFPGAILGICFGHQLIGKAFGGAVVEMKKKTRGFYRLEVLERDTLFHGLPNPVLVYESHGKAVEEIMSGFIHLARSDKCDLEAFRHEIKPIFGVQFHPEWADDLRPHGSIILRNFFTRCSNAT
jgi:GMP synthase (glutamine-hydrolysing)|tara:strand:- start:829 stop:1428 length:600 start_codon:yes stop_codon:yes gene_type:complete